MYITIRYTIKRSHPLYLCAVVLSEQLPLNNKCVKIDFGISKISFYSLVHRMILKSFNRNSVLYAVRYTIENEKGCRTLKPNDIYKISMCILNLLLRISIYCTIQYTRYEYGGKNRTLYIILIINKGFWTITQIQWCISYSSPLILSFWIFRQLIQRNTGSKILFRFYGKDAVKSSMGDFIFAFVLVKIWFRCMFPLFDVYVISSYNLIAILLDTSSNRTQNSWHFSFKKYLTFSVKYSGSIFLSVLVM